MSKRLIVIVSGQLIGAATLRRIIEEAEQAGINILEKAQKQEVRTLELSEPTRCAPVDYTCNGKRQAQWKQDTYCKPGRHRLK